MTPDPQAPGGVREAAHAYLLIRGHGPGCYEHSFGPGPCPCGLDTLRAALAAEPATAGVERAIAELTDALAYVRAEQKAEREGHAVVPAVIAIERRIAALKETK